MRPGGAWSSQVTGGHNCISSQITSQRTPSLPPSWRILGHFRLNTAEAVNVVILIHQLSIFSSWVSPLHYRYVCSLQSNFTCSVMIMRLIEVLWGEWEVIWSLRLHSNGSLPWKRRGLNAFANVTLFHGGQWQERWVEKSSGERDKRRDGEWWGDDKTVRRKINDYLL